MKKTLNLVKIKTPDESEVVMREMVMPNQTNKHNTVFGGVVMSWIDLASAMVCERHSGKPVVTVFADQIYFRAPIKIGEHAVIKARLHYVGKTSMVVGTEVYAENPTLQEIRHAMSAYLTFVAIDGNGRPIAAPQLALKTQADKERAAKAKLQIELNKKNRS